MKATAAQPTEGPYPVLHCATHEKPFPCPDCVAAHSPKSDDLPEEAVALLARALFFHAGGGYWLTASTEDKEVWLRVARNEVNCRLRGFLAAIRKQERERVLAVIDQFINDAVRMEVLAALDSLEAD